jgi:hypothetical protein
VIKTTREDGRKAFINICHSTQVRADVGGLQHMLYLFASLAIGLYCSATRVMGYAALLLHRSVTKHNKTLVSGIAIDVQSKFYHVFFLVKAMTMRHTLLLLLLQVPAPGGWTNGMMPEHVLTALEQLGQDNPQQGNAEALRFPLSCSDVLPDTDKQGQPCSTIDCIIHTDILAAAQQNRHLKAFLIELAIEHANDKHKLHLSPKFKLPKMPYKGTEMRPQRVRVDKKPLVTDVTAHMQQHEEEASFALRSTKVLPKAAHTAARTMPINNARQQQQQQEQQHQGNGLAGAHNASSNDSQLGYHIQCLGKPVDRMVVTFQLPPCSSSGTAAAAASDAACDIGCQVSGRQLRVTVPWLQRKVCTVLLPFAAAKADAEAVLMHHTMQLVVTLRYLPLQQWVQQLVAEAPQSFASLPILHSSYMELD